jgi:hypothetical protein
MRRQGHDLRSFLARHGVGLSDVCDSIRERVGLEDGEVAFISGSVLEGFGTDWSDLDAYLMTERELPEHRHNPMLTFQCGTAVVDLELWNPARIRQLIEKSRGFAHDRVRDPRDALGVSVAEVEMLHRLYTGVPLTGERRHASLREEIDPLVLSRLIFDRAVARISSAQIDLLGLLGGGDFRSSLVLSHTLLGFVADTLLASLGNTNPSDKWRLRKLRQLAGTDWDKDLPGGRLEPSAEDVFFDLMRPDSGAPDALESLAFRCVRLANRIIPWGQRRFLDRTVGPASADDAKRETRHYSDHGSGAAFARLSLACQIRYGDAGLTLSSVGEGVGLVVGRLTHEAVLLFDGRTTRREIVKRLTHFSPAPAAALGKAVNDLKVLLGFYHMVDEGDDAERHSRLAPGASEAGARTLGRV